MIPRCWIFCDSSNNLIRRLDLGTLTVTTLAGTGEPGFQDGPAAQVKMNRPWGLVLDNQGNVIFCD